MFILLWTLLFPICAFSQESKESPKESQRLEAQHQTIELAHSYLHSLNNKEAPLLIQEKKQELKAIWSQQKISPLWLDAQWNSYFILVLHSILQRYQRALMESPFSEENDAKLFSLYSQILKKIAAYDTPLKILYGDIETLLKNHGRGSSSFQKMKDISQALEGHEWNLSQYKRAVKNRGWIENYFESVGNKNQDEIEGYWKNAMSWRQIIKERGVPSDVMEALLEEEKKINKEAGELLEEDRSQVKWVYAGAVALPLLILASKAAIVTGAIVGMSSAKASVGLMVGVPLAMGLTKGLGHFIYNGARDSRHIEVSHFLNELIPELTYALPWAVVGPFLGVGVVKTALKDIARPIFYTLAGGGATSATVYGIRGYEQIENGEVDKGAILLMDSAIDLAAIVGVVAYVNLSGNRGNTGGGSSLKLRTPSPQISPQPHGHGAPPSPHETIRPAITKTFRVQGTEPTGSKAIVMEKEPIILKPQMSVEEMNWAYQHSIPKEPIYPSMGPSIELPSPKPLPTLPLPVKVTQKPVILSEAKHLSIRNDKSTAPQTGFETPDDGMEDVEIVRRDDDGKIIGRRIVRVKKGSTEKEIWEQVHDRTAHDEIVGRVSRKSDTTSPKETTIGGTNASNESNGKKDSSHSNPNDPEEKNPPPLRPKPFSLPPFHLSEEARSHIEKSKQEFLKALGVDLPVLPVENEDSLLIQQLISKLNRTEEVIVMGSSQVLISLANTKKHLKPQIIRHLIETYQNTSEEKLKNWIQRLLNHLGVIIDINHEESPIKDLFSGPTAEAINSAILHLYSGTSQDIEADITIIALMLTVDPERIPTPTKDNIKNFFADLIDDIVKNAPHKRKAVIERLQKLSLLNPENQILRDLANRAEVQTLISNVFHGSKIQKTKDDANMDHRPQPVAGARHSTQVPLELPPAVQKKIEENFWDFYHRFEATSKQVEKDILISNLNHPNVEVRREASLQLAALSDPTTVEPLIQSLFDTDQEVRVNAIEALGRIKQFQAIIPLIELLKDPSIRADAYVVLLKHGELALPALEAAAKKDSTIKKVIKELIDDILYCWQSPVAILIHDLHSEDKTQRLGAILALERRRIWDAVEHLIPLLGETGPAEVIARDAKATILILGLESLDEDMIKKAPHIRKKIISDVKKALLECRDPLLKENLEYLFAELGDQSLPKDILERAAQTLGPEDAKEFAILHTAASLGDEIAIKDFISFIENEKFYEHAEEVLLQHIGLFIVEFSTLFEDKKQGVLDELYALMNKPHQRNAYKLFIQSIIARIESL